MSFKYDSSKSKYCYPGIDILINKLDIKDEKILNEAESLYTAQRLLELESTPIKGTFDLHHLQKIHHYIFQDLYPFAGKLREENISKGMTSFASFQYIEPCAKDLFDKLKSDNYLKDTTLEGFSVNSAFYMAELNMLHPFREGNGRSIREFLRCLALNCNYNLQWTAVGEDELLEAFIESIIDYKRLADCIKRTISD